MLAASRVGCVERLLLCCNLTEEEEVCVADLVSVAAASEGWVTRILSCLFVHSGGVKLPPQKKEAPKRLELLGIAMIWIETCFFCP